MRLSILAAFVVLTYKACGQDLIVAESVRAFYANGDKINHNDVISPETNVRVEQKGKLSVNYKQRWTLYFEKGIHKIDSALQVESKKPEFILHDSICSMLDERGLRNCRFNYKTEVPSGSYHGVRVDNLKMVNPHEMMAIADEVKIEWAHPLEYTGLYFLVIMNVFEEYIGIFELKEKKFNLDLRPFSWSTKVLLYKVIAEDCRESDLQILRRK